MRILLIAGGWSDERDVSLTGAKQIETSLLRLGHEVTPFDPSTRFADLLREARGHDFAFINLHGAPGEDGLIQAMLEHADCPYQGSGPKASFLALNKAATKEILEAVGVPTPAWELVTDISGDADPRLAPPLFVKPNSGGSSLGMSLVRSAEKLRPALLEVFELGDVPLVEQLIQGTEITCGVLGDEALPLILIRPRADSEFFDYQNKYSQDLGAEEICPAPIDEPLAARIRELTLLAHRTLGLNGYSRADYIVRDGEPWLLEVNTLPGMTPTSLVPRAAAAAGYDFDALIAELIRLGLETHGRS